MNNLKKINGLAAWLERQGETHLACASNEADAWDALRLNEAALELRRLGAIEAELPWTREELKEQLRRAFEALAKEKST